ncbi:hypothetical protein [Streptomyces sp. NPDC020965]|uniref:hypothetical protein n=1 Tax=Streptomyces sp. NPDC020965 TaxID=3365105 RepID=UPI0037B38C3F
MFRTENTDTGNVPEPRAPHPPGRWTARARRVRNEAGLYLLRGAATAIGSTIVAYGTLWIQAR